MIRARRCWIWRSRSRLGGDCLADVAVLRAQPELFGAGGLRSDGQPADRRPGRATLVRRSPRSGAARGAARARVWAHRSPFARAPEPQVVIDLDATLVGAHSEKEHATPNFKRGFGFHPMLAFVDHGAGGTGEPLAAMLRPGKANANDAADQIAVLDAALAQLPEPSAAPGCWSVATPAPGSRRSLAHVHDLGLRVLGRDLRPPTRPRRPAGAARAGVATALDADGRPREGAQVAELTRWLPATFTGWPPGMRVIARRERPHPGAQLRITDHEGWRITVFATNTTRRAAGRAGSPPPAAGPRRGPHPRPQGHRR